MENLLSSEERKKAEVQLRTAIQHTVEHDSEEPYVDYEASVYDGGLEPILVAINQALRWGAKSVLDTLEPEEKLRILERLNLTNNE